SMLTPHLNLREWMRRGKLFLRNLGEGEPPFAPDADLPLADDLRNLLRDRRSGRNKYEKDRQHWTAERLRSLLRSELAGDEVLVVSNREPYIHMRADDGIRILRPASGLVTAVEPIMRACSGTWIAHGSGTADRETVDEQDRVRVPPEAPSYTLRRVWLGDEEERG